MYQRRRQNINAEFNQPKSKNNQKYVKNTNNKPKNPNGKMETMYWPIKCQNILLKDTQKYVKKANWRWNNDAKMPKMENALCTGKNSNHHTKFPKIIIIYSFKFSNSLNSKYHH